MVNQNKLIPISTIGINDIFKGIKTNTPDSRKHIKCKGHIDGDNDWCDYDTTVTCDECKYGGSYDTNDKRRGKDPEALCNQLRESYIMTISPIETFRVKDSTIHQSIGLENDIVTFVNCETNKIIFSVDPDCRTFYHNKDNKKIYVGKFGYTDSYAIKFVYDESFARNNIVEAADNRTIFFFDSRLKAIKDFIKAEKVFVDNALSHYPEVFKIG